MINLLNKINSQIKSIEKEMDKVRSYKSYDKGELNALKQERNTIRSIFRDILDSEIELHIAINNTPSKNVPPNEVCSSLNDCLNYKKVCQEEYGLNVDCHVLKVKLSEIWNELEAD